jgi:Family of unknown function (DUF6588)
MKKFSFLLAFCLLFLSKPAFSQSDQFSLLNPTEVGKFAQPLATTLGTGLNSGGFYTANIPSLFGFSISIRGMYIFVPNDQLTFTPSLPSGYTSDKSTATFWGGEGTVYTGPYGYITYPNGINQKSVPFGVPQVTASLMGTEVLVRYLPSINVGGRNVNFFGFGLRHSISQYIPMVPVDIAVQFLYNKITMTNLVSANAYAFNGEVSKSFGLFTAYGGLQYESSKFNITYTIKGDPNSGDPELRQDQNVNVNLNGKDKFRVILGGSVKMAFFVLNVDYNLSSQSVLSGGLSFEF